MNREQAKLLGFSKEDRKTEYSGKYIHLDNVIDIVYDDFESRTCENCEHMKTTGHFYTCNQFYHYENTKVTKDFGCNKHEPKET